MVAGQTGKLEVGLAMSALGQKQTSAHVRAMSALPPKADMNQHSRDVRFVPKADQVHRSKKWPYSISSSARPDSGSGMVMPSVLAVFRLIYSSILVACWTANSAGFSPFRIRPV